MKIWFTFKCLTILYWWIFKLHPNYINMQIFVLQMKHTKITQRNASYLLIWLSFLRREHLESTLVFRFIEKNLPVPKTLILYFKNKPVSERYHSMYHSTYKQIMLLVYDWYYSINVIFPTVVKKKSIILNSIRS